MNARNPAVIVADSSWHSTRNLLETWPPASGPDAALLRLEPIDWRNAHSRGIRPWHWGVHRREVRPNVTLVTAELPPGWMKSYPKPGQWPLARACRRWRSSLGHRASEMALWITYPHYLELADQVRPDWLIYYNLDDYTLYWPAKADEVRCQEARAVARADWTVCVAAERARQLKLAFPERADRILHMPHGAPESTIPNGTFVSPGPRFADFAHFPRPWLGYLGGLEDRIDWMLVRNVAESFPEASVVLVGPKPALEGPEPWREEMRKAIGCPNVYATGPQPQERIGEIYASFDVNLIPYDVSHPFNVVCSPTKLMDAMGCGRPMVATDLPECRIHAERIDVAADHEGFLAAIRRLKESGFRDGRESLRHAFALRHSTARVLDDLYRLI